MDSETTVMKLLIVSFIIGLVSVAAISVGDFYKDAEVYDNTDSIEVPVSKVNVYHFNQKMIYYGSE